MMSLRVLLLLTACAGCLASVTTIRAAVSADKAEALYPSNDPSCTVIYQVNFEAPYTTQGNDLGMLPPHGINTQNFGLIFNSFWGSEYNNTISTIGANYVGQPQANNPAAQAAAAAAFSITALTVAGATPIGFQKDILDEKAAVCVYVRGVQNRWVEVMAQTTSGNQDICAANWLPSDTTQARANTVGTPFKEFCGKGAVYSCLESPNRLIDPVLHTYDEKLNLKFYCAGDCEDKKTPFYWRLVVSQSAPYKIQNRWVQPDDEDWCMTRKGDDYPSSLLNPYPDQYVEPQVFSALSSSSSSLVLSVALLSVFSFIAFLLI